MGAYESKGRASQKEFVLDPEEDSVLYLKQGWEVMACVKSKEQFLKECVVKQNVDGRIPEVLLAAVLPDWIIHPDVVKLFLDDSSKLFPSGRVLLCPKPIPMDCCVGPAVLWARRRAVVLWSEVLLTTLVAWIGMQFQLWSFPSHFKLNGHAM